MLCYVPLLNCKTRFSSGLIGMCISFAGVVVDGSAFSIYKNLKACGHSSSNASIDINDIMVSGNTSYSAGYYTNY